VIVYDNVDNSAYNNIVDRNSSALLIFSLSTDVAESGIRDVLNPVVVIPGLRAGTCAAVLRGSLLIMSV